MIRKILLLALTTGLASKLYRQHRVKQEAQPSGAPDKPDMNPRSDAGTLAL